MTRQEVHAAVEGMPETAATAAPAPGRWSVVECLEHITVVEQSFVGRLQTAAPGDVPPIDKQREANFLEQIPNRSQRAEAPERARPTGRFTNLSDALAAFDRARAETIRFAEAQQEKLYSIAETHGRFGRLNGYEFLILVAAHSRRHAGQICENRSVLACE